MKVKLFYLNWRKVERNGKQQAKWTGDFYADEPKLYDLVFQTDLIVGDQNPEDFLFEKFNIEDRRKFGKHKIRSMCVADVVVYEGKAIVCQGCGWKTVDAPAWMVEATNEVDEQPCPSPDDVRCVACEHSHKCA